MSCSEAAAIEDELGEVGLPIFQGEFTEDCEWPEVVALGGCSATLIHPRLIVYAAHCGTGLREAFFGTDMMLSTRRVPIDYCAAYPEHKLGDGTDIAYCVLKEAVTDIVPARALAGCETEKLAPGNEVTAVGFGRPTPDGDLGIQREGKLRISTVGDELITEDGDVDTCRGDSGGPLFLQVSGQNGQTERRLVGVTSAGSESTCGQGIGHYVNLSKKLAWIESDSGFDVTPCFDNGGTWSPTPGCVAKRAMQSKSNSDEPSCQAIGDTTWLSTCGAAFAMREDKTAPSILRKSPKANEEQRRLLPGKTFVDYRIEVTAKDEGLGVKDVTFTLFDEQGKQLYQGVDEVSPYGMPILRLPQGHYTFVSEASDYAGNKRADSITFEIEPPASKDSSGCHLAKGRASRTAAFALLGLLGGSFAARRLRVVKTKTGNGPCGAPGRSDQ